MLTLDEFNKMYKEYKREKLKNIKVHHVKGFTLYTEKRTEIIKEPKIDENGIPYYKRTVVLLDKPKKRFNVNEFNRLIVAYLEMFTNPISAGVTNTTGKYIPNVGYIANRDKGRADVTAQYKDFELCIETKQKYEKQLESQKKFEKMASEQSFRKYVLVRDFESFQIEMKKIFNFL